MLLILLFWGFLRSGCKAQMFPSNGLPYHPMLIPSDYSRIMDNTADNRTRMVLGFMGFYTVHLYAGPPWTMQVLGAAMPMALRDINNDPDLLPG